MASRLLYLSAGVVSVLCGGCAWPGGAPLETVSSVDIERYAGKWYEIASYPAPFQRGCTGTTAEYTLRPDGTVEVYNRCLRDSLDGPESTIRGVARVVDRSTNAKLAVRFVGPFEGPYWIIDLADDYSWAVVGEPSRSYLWVLARTSALDAATLDAIIARLPEKGYDPSRLRLTPQPAE